MSATGLGELYWLHELLVRLTCHIPDVSDCWPSSIVRPFFSTLRCVAVNIAVHPSFHSFPVDIRASDFRWVEVL